MTGRINNPITFVLTGAVCVLFCSASASAEIHTFWKTNECPNFGKTVIGIVGHMEAPVANPIVTGPDPSDSPPGPGNSSDVFTEGVGGAYCVLEGASNTFGSMLKGSAIFNADITPFNTAGHSGGLGAHDCVVCQYEDHAGAVPALSLLGTAILFGGMLTALFYEFRKRQNKPASA